MTLSADDLWAEIERLRMPDLPPDATDEERALRAMIESGRAKLSPKTMSDLRSSLEHIEPTFEHPLHPPILGRINLIVDPAVPDGYLYVVPEPRPEEADDLRKWLVRWTVIARFAAAPDEPCL